MASNEVLLRALETIMTEFYQVQTTNERKREIESQVNSFGQQEGAWKHCLYFLSNTDNQFVTMYCLTVLETLINKQWSCMLGMERQEIRNTLYGFLLTKYGKVEKFICNKMAKLIVDIGRNDWPNFYPDFFANIIQLIECQDTTSLGLLLLLTASEELAFPREENMCIARKEELRKLLLEQVPAVLSILGALLENILEKHRHLVTATPPPSPTHGHQTPTPQQQQLSSLFSPTAECGVADLSIMFKNTEKSNPFQSLPPLDTESHQLCLQALDCLSHLFSWIPLSVHLTPSLLTTIFNMASLGCEPLPPPLHHGVTDKARLGVLGMQCINEIMAKNCVPQHFQHFMLQMFQNTFHLLQTLTTKDYDCNNPHPASYLSGCSPLPAPCSRTKLAHLDESYVDKFTDFLRVFVNSHLRRFEGNPHFPVLEFLSLLFTYTFQQPALDGFYSCLDIWATFLELLCDQLESRRSDISAILDKYRDALKSLVAQILSRVQFKLNQTSLEELDDDVLDENCETEWQKFLRHCLETISKVGQLLPLETFALVFAPFQENLEIYLGLESFVRVTSDQRHLDVTAENECRRLHCSLRDLSSALQAIGCNANLFIGENFVSHFDTIHNTVQRLCHVAAFNAKLELWDVKTAAPTVLNPDLILVYAHTLAAAKAFSHWLAQYYCQASSSSSPSQIEHFQKLVTLLVEASIPSLLNGKSPDKIRHSSSHLLLSLTSTVRPSFLFTLPCVRQLFNWSTQLDFKELPLQTQLLVYRSLENILLLPWPNVSDSKQEWPTRSEHYAAFVQSLTADLKTVCSACSLADDKRFNEQGKPIVRWTLRVMSDQIENIKEASVRTKQLAYQPTEEIIFAALNLSPIYLSHSDVGEDLMDFFLVLFDVLRGQMNNRLVEQTIQTFLDLFSRDQLAKCILHEDSAGARIVEKFLTLLQRVVQEGSFKAFLPCTINFCMDHIYPIIAQRPSPEVKLPLFELLFSVLLHNSKYFFKSRGVIETLGQPGNETLQNGEHLNKILEAFGQSFLQSDISVYRHNLEALEKLNNKWKLYRKDVFKNVMLNQFLNVLLQTLVHRSHDLLRDEISMVVYNMALVDFENFHRVFLTEFLRRCPGLDENQRNILAKHFSLETDLPTFIQNVAAFVNDLRYYQLRNAALPAGSINFY